MRGLGLVLAVLLAFSASAAAQAEPPRSKTGSPGHWPQWRNGWVAPNWRSNVPPGSWRPYQGPRGTYFLGLGSKRREL